MNKLHHGAKWLFRIHTYIPLLLIGFSFAAYSLGKFNLLAKDSAKITWIPFLFIYFISIIIGTEIYVHLSYNRYFYEVGNDWIKIERGIIWKEYTSIPYGRIQNIDINRGIIARLLGFSTVNFETAGQSGNKIRNEGCLPAIEINDAEKIEEFITKRIQKSRGSG